MTALQYFCPCCQSIELEVQQSPLVGVESGYAACLLCGWRGRPDELLSTIRPDNAQTWTAERMGNALLYVATRHAAGPLMQALELLGLLPPVKGEAEERESAEEIRNQVMRAVLEACVCTAFETTAARAPAHYRRFAPEQAEAVERVFSYAGDA